LIIVPYTILLIGDDSDRAFMEQLYLDYSRLMYSVAVSRLGNPLDAEDAVHEAILRLIDKIALLREKDSCTLRRYIVITTKRVSINLGIKKGRNQSVSMDQEIIESMEDTDAVVDDRVFANIEAEELARALRELPQRERDLLRWKYYEDWPDEEIAYALGIAKNSVRKYLTHARRLLRTLVEEKLK